MTWMSILTAIIFGFNRWVIFYFGLLNGVYLVLFLVSFAEVMRFVKRTFFSDYEQILKSEMTWPISMIVPAYNEARSIVETVRSLLAVNYGQFEVVVVNDGSSDGTLERLISTFELKRTDRIYHRRLPTGPVRGIYASLDYPNLILVDKEWGGKAEALNTGINVSRYPLFCSVDADSIIEENALLRVVKPFMEHPEEMVAAGGIVRIVNGCEVRDGRVVRIGLPRESLPVFQVVEYLRAFLGGRIGWSSLRSLLIISGAFGLYRKSEVIAAGGYDGWSETEDLELVLKLHEHMRATGRRYRIVFVPDPVCWTEVPSTFRVLARQRNRWHRGLLQSLWRHKHMIFNPGHGAIGLLGLPYFLLFETLTVQGHFVQKLTEPAESIARDDLVNRPEQLQDAAYPQLGRFRVLFTALQLSQVANFGEPPLRPSTQRGSLNARNSRSRLTDQPDKRLDLITQILLPVGICSDSCHRVKYRTLAFVADREESFHGGIAQATGRNISDPQQIHIIMRIYENSQVGEDIFYFASIKETLADD